MKVTIALLDYIQSELINEGQNEFFDFESMQLVEYNDKFSFIKKAMRYEEDIDKIVTERFFIGYRFDNQALDKWLKRTFLNRFMWRQIQPQTIENFAQSVLTVTLTREQYIINAFENANKYITGHNEHDNKGNTLKENDYRTATQTLPQDSFNIDVENRMLDSADNNSISVTKDKTKNESGGTSNNYNIDNLLKSFDLFEDIFLEYDKKCFLHVW